MKIGILGLDWDIGIPLALTLRDYGRHSVIAYGDPAELAQKADPPPEKEALELIQEWAIPITDRMDVFAEHCDLVFACQKDVFYGLLQWLNRTRDGRQPLPVVAAFPMPDGSPVALKAWARVHRNLDLGYFPLYIDRSNGIGRLSNPGGPVYVAGSEPVHRAVELAWRPVVNTIPVRRVPLGYQIIPAGVLEGTVEGFPVATEPLGAPPGDVDNPPPV